MNKKGIYLFIYFAITPVQSYGPEAQEIVHHATIIRDIKKRSALSSVNTFTKESKNNPHKNTPKNTQTDAFLKVWFSLKDDEGSSEINEYAKKLLTLYCQQYTKNVEDYWPIVLQMLDNERRYADYYVFYHAYKRELGILFDIYRELYDIFNVQNDPHQAVLVRNLFDSNCTYCYSNVQNFIDSWKGDWNDMWQPLKSLLLSTNISLFGNTANINSGSFHFFMGSYSLSDTSDLLTDFFKAWNFDVKYLRELESIHARYIKPEAGQMLQIFLPQEKVDSLSYLSHSYGKPYSVQLTNSFDALKKRHHDMLSILTLYRNNPFLVDNVFGEDYLLDLKDRIATEKAHKEENALELIKDPQNEILLGRKERYERSKFIDFASPIQTSNQAAMDNIQARILLIPAFFDPASGIKIFRYTLTPEKQREKYQKELHDCIKKMLIDWLKTSKAQEELKKLNVPLSKLMELIQQTIPKNPVGLQQLIYTQEKKPHIFQKTATIKTRFKDQ